MEGPFPDELRAEPDRLLHAGSLYTRAFNAALAIEMRINPGRGLPISFFGSKDCISHVAEKRYQNGT